jgi:Zn-dependent peptidase ImmA (M78 family)
MQVTLDFKDTSPTFYCRSRSKKPPEEYQADMFAGSLLMPKPIIQKVINNMKAHGKLQMRQLYKLAPLFQVSISALTVRLKQLDLLYIDDDGKIYDSRSESLGQITFDL